MKYFLSLILFATQQVYGFDLFGPNNFQDCLLQNLKGVNNSDAVNTITAACSMKFNQIDNSSNKNDGIRKCFIYWDGISFVLGSKPKDYTAYSITYESVPVLQMSFPNVMVKNWTIKHEDKANDIFKQYYPQIKSLCNWRN